MDLMDVLSFLLCPLRETLLSTLDLALLPPWESFLRSYDRQLQELSTDVAVRALDLIDWLFHVQPAA